MISSSRISPAKLVYKEELPGIDITDRKRTQQVTVSATLVFLLVTPNSSPNATGLKQLTVKFFVLLLRIGYEHKINGSMEHAVRGTSPYLLVVHCFCSTTHHNLLVVVFVQQHTSDDLCNTNTIKPTVDVPPSPQTG